MPAKTDKQRKLMAIAEHAPEKLFKKNRGVLKMTQGQLHDFAAPKGASKTGHAYDFRKQKGRRAPAKMNKVS